MAKKVIHAFQDTDNYNYLVLKTSAYTFVRRSYALIVLKKHIDRSM
ncbi:hypothetical protein MST22_12600 [Virgibacillus halodenitrificans]|nr:hypothetical protein [Virgibacillus halodenitrificans]